MSDAARYIVVPFDDVDRLHYPDYFTAMFDYVANCEGHTVGLFVGYAGLASELRTKLEARFTPYFARSSVVWQGLALPREAEAVASNFIRDLVREPCQMKGTLDYVSILHINGS